MNRVHPGRYAKFITAVLGVVSSGLASYYAGRPWVPVVIDACAAITVYLIPNQPTAPPPS